MRKILVPLDGSPLAEAALPVAERRARERSARVLLLSVGELPETSTHRSEEHHALRAIVDAAAARLSGVDTGVRTDLGGDVPAAILRVAEEEAIDEIVMSTHGRSGLSRWTQGSVAEAVLRRSPVPVTLVRPGGGDEEAQHALVASGDCHDVVAAASAIVAGDGTASPDELRRLRDCIARTPERDRLPAVETYLALLDPRERTDAVVEFIGRGGDTEREGALAVAETLNFEAIPALAEITDADSPDACWAAYEAIKAIGGDAAILPLIRGLRSDQVSIRWIASNGLAEIGRPALFPLLHELATADPAITFHRAARRVLREIDMRGHEAETSRLLRSLGHDATVVQSPPLAEELLQQLRRDGAGARS